MIVVHFAKVSALYSRVVISSLIGRLENSVLPFFTLPLVYGSEITTCHYKGLLQEYVMLCYDFHHRPRLQCQGFPHRPLLHHVGWVNCHANSHSSEQDTQPIIFLISEQVTPYRTRGSTCCPGVSTPKVWFFTDSSNHMP
jgi:hypothetical protein